MLALVKERQIIIGLNDEAITEWIEYRKEKGKPLSARALAMSERFLLKYGEAHQMWLVECAIMNDWQGLHVVDEPKEKTTRSTKLIDDLTDTSWAH